jgi:hypothetical protein
MRAQQFLEQFRTPGSDPRAFFYGLERSLPNSSLLFLRQTDALPASWQSQTVSLPSALASEIDVRCPPGLDDYAQGFRNIIVSHAEMYVRRVSMHKFSCLICSKPISRHTIVDHLLNAHASILATSLKRHFSFLNDDSAFMDGFMGKLQFDATIANPTLPYSLHRRSAVTVCAPPINSLSNYPTATPGEFSFTCNGIISPLFTDLLARTAPLYPKQTTPHPGDPNADPAVVYHLDPIIREMRKPPPKPRVTGSNPDLKPKPIEPKPSPPKAPAPERPASSPLPPPPKIAPPKPPQILPYLDTIPDPIRDSVIRTLSERLTRPWVETQVLSIVRPVFQMKKKQQQKRAREERQQKAKIEEKQRFDAMRRRRQLAIDNLVNRLSSPLLRLFVRSEIDRVFEDEEISARGGSLSLKVSKTDGELKPVVLSGLVNRKALSTEYLGKQLGAANLAVDEDGGPKIRFRASGNRFDVLVYVASEQDINQLISQRSVQGEFGIATVWVDPEEAGGAGGLASFTGQNLVPTASARNLDGVARGEGGAGVAELIPVLCVNERPEKSGDVDEDE